MSLKWHPINKQILMEGIRMGLPGILVLVEEWGFYELMPFIAGAISEIDLATAAALFNFEITSFVFFAGFTKVCCNKIG